MASELTGFGKFCKWVALPAALFAVGRFAVGPRIGGLGEKIPQVRQIGKIAREMSGKAGTPPPVGPAAPKGGTKPPAPPASESAAEFQRIREAPEVAPAPKPAPNSKPKARRRRASSPRTPIDEVGNE